MNELIYSNLWGIDKELQGITRNSNKYTPEQKQNKSPLPSKAS